MCGWSVVAVVAAGLMLFGVPWASAAEQEEAKPEEVQEQKQEQEKESSAWAPAVEPKPLSENAKRGLAWLIAHQHSEGGWGQGEESEHMGRSLEHLTDKPNVADTCMAALALIRSGSTPKNGEYAKNILSAVQYVCGEIKASEEGTLYITQTRGTRLQAKLGTYIDTFLAAMLLAEVKGKMPDEDGEKMVFAAFHKVMDKIEKNQRADGTFGETGWANALSVSMASKGLNRGAQAGLDVPERARSGLEKYARDQWDDKTGTFSEKGAAGVKLYAAGANLGAMQDSDNTNKTKRAELERIVREGKTAKEREDAQKTLGVYDATAKDLKGAQDAVIKKLDDKQFISGFGSNGGEEFLSYMNIGESLVVKGGEAWEKWDKEMTANLNRIQNDDGSWTGHHCITGRTFCTATALLVLMTDRAPVPLAAKVQAGKEGRSPFVE